MTGAVRYWGKYRGRVIDNLDPLFQGRIIADTRAVATAATNWALPCTPYAGPDVGFYAIPPIGANVWIEFEGGDPNYPVWVGCFWSEGDVPRGPVPPTPDIKIFRTETVSLVVSDLPEGGGVALQCDPPAVSAPLSMTVDATGVSITCPDARIAITPAGITVTTASLDIVAATTIAGPLAVDGGATVTGGIVIAGGGTIDGAPIL